MHFIRPTLPKSDKIIPISGYLNELFSVVNNKFKDSRPAVL